MEQFNVEEDDPVQLPVYQKQLRQRANLCIQDLNSVLEPLNTDGEILLHLLTTVQQEGRSEAFQDLVPMIHNQSDYIRLLEAEVRLCKVEKAEEMEGNDRTEVLRSLAQQRLQLEVNVLKQSLAQAKEEGTRKEELAQTCIAEVGGQLCIAQKKELFLDQQLDTAKCHIANLLTENAKMCADLGYQHNQAVRKKEEAEKEIRNLKSRNIRQLENSAKVLMSLSQQRLQLEVLKQSLAQATEEGTQKEELAQTCIAEVEGQLEKAKCHIANLLTENAKHVAERVGQLGRAQREKSSLTDQLESARRNIIDQDKDNVKHVAELEGQLGRAQREKSSLSDDLEAARLHIIQQDQDNIKHVAELEGQLGRAQREKSSLTDQLESARRHIIDQDKDNVKMSADLRYQHNQAMRKKEEAERELSNLKSRNIRQLENSAKEVEGLSSELAGCRIRLGVVQKDGSQWQDKALSLTEQLANAQRQLNLTSHAVKSAERSHKELMASTTLTAQETDRDITLLEARHKHRVEELDWLLGSQNSWIKKLMENCNILVSQLEEMANRHRRKEQQTAMEKRDLQDYIASLEARSFDLK